MATQSRSKAHPLVVLRGESPARPAGEVWLVGAGPGDPELLTLKALRVLQGADVVVHDGLVSDAILDLAPASARRLSVAKRKSRHSYAQDEINRLLVAFALDGLTVVRLKGGDPFIFGRGGEELEACRAAGVVCHVVPGVTAALAAGASAGAPLTHRGAAQAVTFVTGHAAAGEPDLDWASLARANQTVVIYMGLSQAAPIAARLMAAGRAASTPALIVENASRADERRIVTSLAGLAEAASGLGGPALLIVGEAMALALPLSQSGRGGPSAEEPMVERASLKLNGTTGRPMTQQVELSLSTPRSPASGPPLPLRGKGKAQ
jgi:uroporphyrin-III C-methyltransferase